MLLRRAVRVEVVELAAGENLAVGPLAVCFLDGSLDTFPVVGRLASNYADSLRDLQHFEESRSLLRKTVPVARRVLGENDSLTLTMRWNYANALYKDDDATRGDLREAVTTLEDTERIARRVLGGAHPLTMDMEGELQGARDALYARGLP